MPRTVARRLTARQRAEAAALLLWLAEDPGRRVADWPGEVPEAIGRDDRITIAAEAA